MEVHSYFLSDQQKNLATNRGCLGESDAIHHEMKTIWTILAYESRACDCTPCHCIIDSEGSSYMENYHRFSEKCFSIVSHISVCWEVKTIFSTS